jgi:Tfp pilus assembly protein PilO
MQIPAEEARLSRIEQYNTTWGDQMPATRDVVDVFGEINRIVSQSGSTTEEFTPGAPTSVGPLMKTSLKMTCKGTLAQIKDLLVGLERLPRTVWTEELRLTGASETGQPMTCQITLEVFSSQSGFSE